MGWEGLAGGWAAGVGGLPCHPPTRALRLRAQVVLRYGLRPRLQGLLSRRRPSTDAGPWADGEGPGGGGAWAAAGGGGRLAEAAKLLQVGAGL